MILLYTVISFIVAFINSTVKYCDLGGTGTVKIRYRGIPWYREYRPSLGWSYYPRIYSYLQLRGSYRLIINVQTFETTWMIGNSKLWL